MIFGMAKTKPMVKYLVLLLALSLPALAADSSWGLSELMIELGRVKQAKGTFVEKKYLKLLNAPLESSGRLIYTAPYRLEKLTLAPKPESMVIDQDTLTIEMRGRTRSLQIQDYPVLWAFVESMRGTLRGDLSALRQFYKVKLDGSRQAWQLQLQPTEKKMTALIQSIVIRGSKDRMNVIEIIEADGDRSEMTVTEEAVTSAAPETNGIARTRMNTAS